MDTKKYQEVLEGKRTLFRARSDRDIQRNDWVVIRETVQGEYTCNFMPPREIDQMPWRTVEGLCLFTLKGVPKESRGRKPKYWAYEDPNDTIEWVKQSTP